MHWYFYPSISLLSGHWSTHASIFPFTNPFQWSIQGSNIAVHRNPRKKWSLPYGNFPFNREKRKEGEIWDKCSQELYNKPTDVPSRRNDIWQKRKTNFFNGRDNLFWVLKILEELVGYHKQKRECIWGQEGGREASYNSRNGEYFALARW